MRVGLFWTLIVVSGLVLGGNTGCNSYGYFHWLRLDNGVWTSMRAGRIWGPGR